MDYFEIRTVMGAPIRGYTVTHNSNISGWAYDTMMHTAYSYLKNYWRKRMCEWEKEKSVDVKKPVWKKCKNMLMLCRCNHIDTVLYRS